MKFSISFFKISVMTSILLCSYLPDRLFDNSLLLLASPTVADCSLERIRDSIESSIIPSPFPTVNTNDIEWSNYHNLDYGFSFEYPTVFDKMSNPACSPRGVKHIDGSGLELYVGSSTAIYIWKLQDPTWQDYACRSLMFDQDVWNLESLDVVQLDGAESLEARYHDEQGNPGITLFTGLGQNSFTINLVNNPSCDEPHDGIDGQTVFFHMLDSFNFNK